RTAYGVDAVPCARIASATPGASRSITVRVASGVTSRALKPVPPVVMTRSLPTSSTRRSSAALIIGASSRTTSCATSVRPAAPAHDAMVAPLVSSRVPDATPSEMVSTATRIGCTLPPRRSVLVERRTHDLRRHRLSAHHHFDHGARPGGVHGHVGQADALLQPWWSRTARDLAGRLTGEADLVAVSGKAALLQHERDEPLAHSALLLRTERITPDEVALVQLRYPAESRLQRSATLVEVIAVEDVSHLETE